MQGNKAETEFKRHLIAQGMMFAAPMLVEKRLRKLMGKARYTQYLDTCDEYRAGSVSIDALYGLVKTLDEANALMSGQAEATLRIGAALYELTEPYISKGMRACELGCYTGGFTSWLAGRHPECTFVGVDRQEHLLALAYKASGLPKLSYRVWDYTRPPTASEEFDVLFSCFGIDLNSGDRSVHHSLDPYDRRSGEAYARIRLGSDPILVNWRAAAKLNGRLFAALRIADYDTCLALIDSAESAGWTCSYEGSSKVRVGDEAFPILSFVAGAPEHDSHENDLLLWWLRHSTHSNEPLWQDGNFLGNFTGAEALLRYRELKDRRVRLEQSRTYDDLHTMRLECGITGNRFYRFKIATTGYCEIDFSMTEDLSGL